MPARIMGGVALAVVLVATGLAMVGSAEHPANLFLVWLFPVTLLETYRRKGFARRLRPLVVIVVAAAAYGVYWTLGAERAITPGGLLVVVGMVAAVVLTEYGRRGSSRERPHS